MKKLLYVPILHSPADLGSFGAALAQSSARRAGEARWQRHEATVARYWEAVAAYLRSFDPRSLALYQDGLAAGDEVGRRVVREAADRGSQNYRLILELLEQGAQLRQAEDPHLLLQERALMQRALQPGRGGGGQDASEWLQAQKARLTAERDAFIAAAIAATLRDGEVGVLFIGAAHDVLSLLPPDLTVAKLKEPAPVREYLEALLAEPDEARVEELGRYLAAPVSPAGL